MGIIVVKAPKTTVVDWIVKMAKKFANGFMNFADVGFRYIDNPRDLGVVIPKKRED